MPLKFWSRHRKKIPRVVIDTSVVIAGIRAFKSEPYEPGTNSARDLLVHWIEKGGFTWIYNQVILKEYKEVAARKRIKRPTIGLLINLLSEEAEDNPVTSSRRISPDPKDDDFCTCAEEGEADYIITLNLKDFPQSKLKAKVISPDDFCVKQGLLNRKSRFR